MVKFRTAIAVATAAVLASACAQLSQGAAGTEGIDPAEAAQTALLHVDNLSPASVELRTVINGQSRFIGSVGANDSTSILLDPTIFPTGFLYLTAVPPDGRRRALVGPLSVGKGDRIRFTVEHALEQSHATVTR